MAVETKKISKVLVANRGEIAVRVIRAARDAGIASVAVYAEPDAQAPFASLADEAFALGGTTSAESYLVFDKILDAAEKSGADAIHPGYGFLSENADFAQAVIDAGLTWIGPSPESIRDLGDKVTARHIAERAEAPMAPGTKDPVAGADEVQSFAMEYGLPVAIKAAFGGGGRGMRIVRTEAALINSVATTRTEAKAAFGSDKVYLEKFLENPRHIEIQVLSDNFQNAVYLGERDCSMQRRNQKVLEESPAPGIPRKLIDKLGARCVDACKRIGYRGAGTFEFLYENGEFYFIEMNTRVQVEHPVTELVTGVDIVREQIAIAAGERLSIRQKDIEVKGHAVECRINAEDPFNFRPCPGKVTMWHMPGGPGIRLDSHVFAGYRIPPYYDSMIGKLIAYGPDRETAMARMRVALSETAVEGITTNIALHRMILADSHFLQGGTSIHYLEKKLAEWKAVPNTNPVGGDD